MSIETWKCEFYPVEPCDISIDNALGHSINKWTGLLPENITAHGLTCRVSTKLEDANSADSETFRISGDTCALCHKFAACACEKCFDEASREYNDGCADCPISLSRNGIPCDEEVEGERGSPWDAWVDDKDPYPMLAALHKAKLYQIKTQSQSQYNIKPKP